MTDLVRGVMEKNSSRMTRLSGLRKGGGTRIRQDKKLYKGKLLRCKTPGNHQEVCRMCEDVGDASQEPTWVQPESFARISSSGQVPLPKSS